MPSRAKRIGRDRQDDDGAAQHQLRIGGDAEHVEVDVERDK